MRIQRNTYFDPTRNMTTVFGERLCGYMYDEELASIDGMHFHIWVPEGTSMDKLRKIASEISQQRDMVSMSFDVLN